MIRRSAIFSILLCIVVTGSLAAFAAEPAIDPAIASGLEFLSKEQNSDGSFDESDQRLATTGLSLLAFLSTGNTADGGRHSAVVRRAIDLLMRQAPADRYFGRVDGSGMDGQAIVTLALVQACGVEPDDVTRTRMRGIIKDAVAILVAAQNIKKAPEHDGGWNKDPAAQDSDPAISRRCLEALRAARRIGMTVPKENLDRAAAYVARTNPPATTQPTSQPKSPTQVLLESQQTDGSWPAEPDRIRSTALAIWTLSAPLKLMPQ